MPPSSWPSAPTNRKSCASPARTTPRASSTACPSCGRWPWAKRSHLGDRVVVVGGGNTAIDTARTALRLGSREVTLVYRRTRAEMPANEWEIDEALEEGVKLEILTQPVEVLSDNGHVSGSAACA